MLSRCEELKVVIEYRVDLEHEFLPVISDQTRQPKTDEVGKRKSWYPMEMLELAFEQPITSNAVRRLLINEIDKAGLLSDPVNDVKEDFLTNAGSLIREMANPKAGESCGLFEIETNSTQFTRIDTFTEEPSC